MQIDWQIDASVVPYFENATIDSFLAMIGIPLISCPPISNNILFVYASLIHFSHRSLPQIKAYRADDSATPKVQLPPASPEEEVQPASTKAAAEDELLSAPPTKKAKVDDDAEAEAEAEAELPEGDISSAPADEV